MSLTKPEFSIEISKPSLVVRPDAIKIFAAILTSLKHLQRNTSQYR